MIQTLIKFVLSKLVNVTGQQWELALHWVQEAARDKRFSTGAERKAEVIRILKKAWPAISTLALNVLIEVAVAFIRRK
jgi:hypothetical protein